MHVAVIKLARIVDRLRAFESDEAFAAAQQYLGADADCAQLGVFEERREFARRAVGDVAHVWQQCAHVRALYFVCRVGCRRIVLVGVARVEHVRLVKVAQRNFGFDLCAGVAVGAFRGCMKLDLFARD